MNFYLNQEFVKGIFGRNADPLGGFKPAEVLPSAQEVDELTLLNFWKLENYDEPNGSNGSNVVVQLLFFGSIFLYPCISCELKIGGRLQVTSSTRVK